MSYLLAPSLKSDQRNHSKKPCQQNIHCVLLNHYFHPTILFKARYGFCPVRHIRLEVTLHGSPVCVKSSPNTLRRCLYLDSVRFKTASLAALCHCSVEEKRMPCNQCSKTVAVESALWTQDFDANSIVFCSDACQELWIAGRFPVRLKSRAVSSAARGQQNVFPN